MVKFLVYLVTVMSAMSLFKAPWVSALLYSFVSVMQPQYIWFWAFNDFSIFTISAAIAILAWGVSLVEGKINFEVYKSGQFKGMLGLLVIFHLSNFFTPFQSYFSLVSADLVVKTFTTIFIMFSIVLPLVNSERTAKYFCFVFIFTAIYYSYWANDHYLSGNWSQFTLGRLNGPNYSPYKDGNVASIVITTAMAFVLFGVRYFNSKIVKYSLIFSVPFLWHALILFASRGALLSAAAVTLFFAFHIKSKSLNVFILIGFVVMLLWQGGMLVERSSKTVTKSQSTSVEEPINPRILSWQVGIDIVLEYPILGAGPQRFQYASALLFPGKSPHVAHNTLLNFSANTGLIAGAIFLSFFYCSYKQFKYVKEVVKEDSTASFINLSCMGGLVGYFVGAFFLDLIIFEPFYSLLLLITANYYLVREKVRLG